MRILYHILYSKATGADRWIYEGWRDVFNDLGHEFFEMNAGGDLKEVADAIRPHIFMTAINLLNLKKDIIVLKQMRRNGTKIFLWVHWPLIKNILKEAEPYLLADDIADVYFGEREPESMMNFEKTTGKKYHVIPNAANRTIHFPTSPVDKYQYDIVYLGAKLPLKKWFYDNVLLPLTKKYKVGIFGPYWTLRDNILRVGSRFCKNIRYKAGTSFFDNLRILIPPEDENKLYSSAKICLNFHEREKDGSQPHYILNQRTFKIPACGGFQICDCVPALRKYFSEDEVITASLDSKDWFKKIEYYLNHDKERNEIREKGTKRVLKEHTYHNRAEQIMSLYEAL
jgi:spore maturation protein CgeB